MSKLFWDKHIIFEEIEVELRGLDLPRREKIEIEHLIDQLVSHRVLDRILTHLPKEHHEDFLDKFHKAPYDEKLLKYLDERIEDSVEDHIKHEVGKIKKEILDDILSSKKVRDE
jgi:hypothetical protein